MATLLEGTDGAFKVGPSGSEATVGYLTEYEVEIDQEIKKQGPFIGNANIAKIRGGLDCKGSCKGFMVTSMDAGQAALLTAINTGADVRLLLEMGASPTKTVTIATAIISNFKSGNKADEGIPVSFDFEANGGYTMT